MLHNSYKKIKVARNKPDLQDVNSHLWEKHVRIVSFYLTILSLSHNSGKKNEDRFVSLYYAVLRKIRIVR